MRRPSDGSGRRGRARPRHCTRTHLARRPSSASARAAVRFVMALISPTSCERWGHPGHGVDSSMASFAQRRRARSACCRPGRLGYPARRPGPRRGTAAAARGVVGVGEAATCRCMASGMMVARLPPARSGGRPRPVRCAAPGRAGFRVVVGTVRLDGGTGLGSDRQRGVGVPDTFDRVTVDHEGKTPVYLR